VADLSDDLRGTVRIAIATDPALAHLPRVLGCFHRDHPRVTLPVESTTLGNDGIVAAVVAEGQVDLAVLTPTGPVIGATVQQLAFAPLTAVLPKAHRLAGRSRVGSQISSVMTSSISRVVTTVGCWRTAPSLPPGSAGGWPSRSSTCAAPWTTSGAASGWRYCRGPVWGTRTGWRWSRCKGVDLGWPLTIACNSRQRPSAATQPLVEVFGPP
jgi:DNA-binding transcriptional LysR family regulator